MVLLNMLQETGVIRYRISLTPINTKRARLHFTNYNFRINVIKEEAIFLLKGNYFRCSHFLEENS